MNTLTRSVLYNIEPIGIGTGYIESLSSYISRLASLHLITTGDLINKIISPKLNKKYLLNISEKGGNGFYKSSCTINGLGSTAKDFSDCLQMLTDCNNSHRSTLLFWKGILPTRGLNNDVKAWCPACYQMALDQDQPVYDQLLWTIQPYEHCILHGIKLLNVCPNCQSKLLILERKTTPGYCSKCSSWLGQPNNSEQNVNYNTEREILLADMLTFNPLEIKEEFSISKSTKFYLNYYFDGSITMAAKHFGYSKSTISEWKNGGCLPTISNLLNICRGLELSISDYFNLKIKSPIKSLQKAQLAITENIKSNKNKDHNLISEILKIIIHNKLRISIKKIALLVGCDRRLLSRKYPEECEIIKQNYARWLAFKKKKRLKLLKRKINNAMYVLNAKGFYPSRRRVEELIGVSKLYEREIQEYWKTKQDQLFQNYEKGE